MNAIQEACSKAIETAFDKNEGSRGCFQKRVILGERITLPTFVANEDALFFPILKRTTESIPVKLDSNSSEIPSTPEPSLLMYDLENNDNKISEVYKHISETKTRVEGSALYGTSGIGKTRKIFEYLSHNKGFYLLSGDSTRNAGSLDFFCS